MSGYAVYKLLQKAQNEAGQEEQPKENAPESSLRQDFAKFKDGYLTKTYLVEGSAGVSVVLTNATNKKRKDA